MKARVKGTTDIIEVEFDKDALNACYPPYHDKEHNMYYQPEQLEWVDNEVNAEPDYWTKLEHMYAGIYYCFTEMRRWMTIIVQKKRNITPTPSWKR